MNELLRFSRRGRIEAQGAPIGISVAIANRPLACLALVRDAEVTVTVDEIARCIAQFLEGSEDFGARRRPVRCGDHSLEPKRTEKFERVSIELALCLEQEFGGITIPR